MSFSLARFTRRAPATMLVRYLAARGMPMPEALKWAATPRVLAIQIREAIEALERRHHDQIISDFERVDKLCNPIGQQVLQSLISSSGNTVFLTRLRSADSDETRGIMVLLDDEALFERALAVSYAERLRNGRSWSAFVVPDTAKVTLGTGQIAALEKDVASALGEYDGSGAKLKIDTFRHRTHDRDAKPIGHSVHHTIYAEGMTVTELQFEGQEPRPHARRPVHEGAICYDPDRRTLDVVSRGGKPTHKKVAQSYARHILGVTTDLRSVHPRSFNLDRLKRRNPFPSDPADGLKSVNVVLLRLFDLAGGNGWVTLEVGDSGQIDIYDLSESWFNDADLLKRANWRVTQAKLRITFHPELRRTREKIVTIELRWPNGSNLREQLRHHQIISEKYLARWRLVESPAI